LQPHQAHRLGCIGRFIRIQSATRVAGINRTESAGSRTYITHQHDRSCATVPALADIWAHRLLANRGETIGADIATDARIPGTGRQPDPEPGRLLPAGNFTETTILADTVFNCRISAWHAIFFATLNNCNTLEFTKNNPDYNCLRTSLF